jgi:hypothetical protein
MRKMIILKQWSPPLWPPLSGQSPPSASEPLSPHEIMVKQGKTLPVELWDAF